ncbi:MAG: cytosine deaminase, partial [Pseudomonadota bacterium]
MVRRDLVIAGGRIAEGPADVTVEMGGAIALPCPVDMHTHLDKGHIWPRRPNPDGTFMGALTSVGEDRAAHWSAGDVAARMGFALEAAWAHGTRAVRTHIDSIPPQDAISWPIFATLRAEWAGRIELQGVSLIGVEGVEDTPAFHRIGHAAQHPAMLGHQIGGPV